MTTPKKILFSLTVACIGILAFSTAHASPGKGDERLAKRVILVMWDGFDPSYMDGRANTPTLDRMIAEGAYYPEVMTTYPSITNTSFSSIITGAYPDTTGIRAVWWDREANQAYGQDRIFDAETIVESLRRGGRTSASINMWLFIGRGLSSDTEDALYLQPEDEKINRFDHRVDLALEFLAGKRAYVPDFLTVYTNTLDSTGHGNGASSPKVIEAIERLDKHLGRLLAGIKELGQEDETTVILTGDHGMNDELISIRDNVTDALAENGYRLQWMSTSGDKNRAALPATEVVGVTFGRTASIFFKGRNVAGEAEQRPFTLKEKQEVRAIFKGIDHVARVLTRDELDELRAHPDVGDMAVEAQVPYCFSSRSHKSTHGMHGSTQEQHFPLILWGEGIKEGVRAENGRSVDIAPTIARILDAPAPAKAEGRVLTEALELWGSSD